ncbi:MAG: histidine phosphatase family protein [Gammaproteobacteria bacterium]
MTSKIMLLRHGKPEFDLFSTGRDPYAAAQLSQVIRRYTQSPIAPAPPPPVHALQHARDCRAIVCSDLRRSLESATRLGHAQKTLIAPLFREAELPYADWQRPRLSLYSWFVIFRLLWLFGYAQNGESLRQARRRAIAATDVLTELARQHGSVLLVGHGFMNHFIARQLRARGWQGPKSPGRHYWEYGVYEA